MFSMVSVKAYAAIAAYNTSTSKHIATLTNDTASSKTVSIFTRPTSGTGGAKVSITKSNGDVITYKVFSYFTDTPALTVNVPSSQIRRIYVQPNTSGQTVRGNLTYNIIN